MTRIDRHVAIRMLGNFVLLFLLLYLFAVVIDVMLNLDAFSDAASRSLPDDAGALSRIFSTVMLALGYQLPQLFQFYAWLWGILVIGATAFTIAQMSRHRELVALLASGWNLQRVTVPILVVTGGLGVVQILNQELVLPRMAPLLLRTHEQAGQAGVRSFSIPITVETKRRLLQASDYDPIEERQLQPNINERTVDGLAVRRIRADRADWNPASDSWVLQNGIVTSLERTDGEVARAARPETIESVETDLSPRRLLMRRHGALAGMLSVAQINVLLDGPETRESDALRRSLWSRFVIIGVNILILLIALPFFLDRYPVGLVQRSVICAGVVLPLYITAAAFMLVPIPGLSPMVSAFIPLVLLLPIGLARFAWMRT